MEIITTNTSIDKLDGFSEFWDVYNYKIARAKCEEIWKRKKLHLIKGQVIAAANAYVAIRGDNPKYWKHPSGWLNAERYNDEHATPVSPHSATFSAFDDVASLLSQGGK